VDEAHEVDDVAASLAAPAVEDLLPRIDAEAVVAAAFRTRPDPLIAGLPELRPEALGDVEDIGGVRLLDGARQVRLHRRDLRR
jgi:hypothetical protein